MAVTLIKGDAPPPSDQLTGLFPDVYADQVTIGSPGSAVSSSSDLLIMGNSSVTASFFVDSTTFQLGTATNTPILIYTNNGASNSYALFKNGGLTVGSGNPANAPQNLGIFLPVVVGNGIAFSSAGTDYGLMGNTATDVWGLGHGTDFNVLQTTVLTWDKNGNVVFTSAGATIAGAGYVEMSEVSAPAAPAANKGRLFLQDNGSGKTQICVRFPTGAVQVIATEP